MVSINNMDLFLTSLDFCSIIGKQDREATGVGARRQHHGVQEQEWQTLHSTFLKFIKFKQRKL